MVCSPRHPRPPARRWTIVLRVKLLSTLVIDIELVPYSSNWPALFEHERRAITHALGKTALAVHHVGSTSVLGLSAKPAIDISLAVADSTDEPSYLAQLETVSYQLHRREPDWFEHRLLRRESPTVNLHIFTTGCKEIDRMLRFRDRLRNSDDDRQLYERTKRSLAHSRWPSTQAYADAKSEIIGQILARA